MDETLDGIEHMPRCCTTIGVAWPNCTGNLCNRHTNMEVNYHQIIVKVFVF